MYTRKLALLVLATSCLAVPSQAQLVKAVKAAESAIQKAVTQKVVVRGISYHPIFGYVTPLLSADLGQSYPVTSDKIQASDFTIENRLIQTAPILTPVNFPLVYIDAFSHTRNLSVKDLTEATYLYRLAYPTQQPGTGHISRYLAELLSKANNFLIHAPNAILSIEELPSLQLLARLQDPAFVPNSYAEMARLFADYYPKHVTLTEEGIPVKTAQDDIANILDIYLMLANPKLVGKFNNTAQGDKYAKFILTPEERAAADKLLSSRRESEKLPDSNPSTRDLIELAYNRLESHTVPYTEAEMAGPEYKAYPNYKNTSLYCAIQGLIRGKDPIEKVLIPSAYPQIAPHYEFRLTVSEDISHLIVLNCIMGGVKPNDLHNLAIALHAFNDFSASLEKTPENIEHIRLLQQNLRIVFAPVMERYHSSPENALEDVEDIGWEASWLLKESLAEELVGRSWQQYSR